MLANAFFVATVIFLGLAFTLMGQLRFLIPWRALLWHEYWRGILLYCFLLFANILGLTIWIERKFWLRDTGRKLKHLDQEIHSGRYESTFPVGRGASLRLSPGLWASVCSGASLTARDPPQNVVLYFAGGHDGF